MSAAIECKNLCFGYDSEEILTDVTLKIQSGEFIGLIGPNGGGKSTFLKLVMGFLSPIHGSIKVLGTSAEKAQSQIAYVPQNIRFDRHFPITVLELVLGGRLSYLPWWGRFYKEDKDKAYEALVQVGLADIACRPFGTLSGGQQQRALIARSLASDPQIFLLDEPTANVDPEAEIEILKILNALKNRITILMVTHDLQTAIHQFDRVLVVKHEILSYSPEEVCKHHAIGLYHPPLIDIRQHSHD
jgi:zinc transport system ATP-binding protein